MKKQIVQLVAASVILVSANGCALFWAGAGAAAGVGSVMYVTGQLRVTEEASFETVWDAAIKAMNDLDFPVTRREYTDNRATLTARTADDKRITVLLNRVAPDLTDVRIRVGMMGDESLSRRILERIQANY